ncbi:MAG: hypothetical protein HYU28_12560 [Actinobacteria bacterium]|nr:hypothetical protein [Actinomycetota bacterium]
MTARFAATAHLRSLKGFQRATVDHVIQRFYDDDPPARRFLVADETGLGKSMVARGVIARTIERLQDDPSVPRIDVVYVCSNAAIAEQNLKNLDVLGTGSSRHSTRLTLLARDSNDLQGDPHPEVGKRVNLISFTPGTSLDLGNSTGRADERALLHIILCEHLGLTAKRARKAAAVVLRGASNLKNILWEITNSKRALGDRGPDDTITRPFLRDIRKSGVLRRFEAAVAELGRRTAISDGERYAHASLVGDLRNALARAGVDALEPDLVILDEFQRFRHILALDDPRFRDAAELAHTLFDHGDTRVLLLSATPYKPFTYAEEGENGDDHDTDLKRTLTFLAMSNGGPAVVSGITDQLAQYRRAAVDGADTTALRALLRRSLLNYMCRVRFPPSPRRDPGRTDGGRLLEVDAVLRELW